MFYQVPPAAFVGKRPWEWGDCWETWVLGPEPGHNTKSHQASLTPLERVKKKTLSPSQRVQRLGLKLRW